MNTAARIYCGTYKKYNSGSIAGAWLTLSDYAGRDEFLAACRELHKDESDPELMFQDYEGFPSSYYCESSAPSEELWTEYLSLTEDERQAFGLFAENYGKDATVDDFRDAYQGTYESEAEFAENMASECGDLPKLPDWIVIDWQASWDSGLRFDYWSESDSEGNLHIFRNT